MNNTNDIGDLYEFKYLVKKSGEIMGTFTIGARGIDEDGAKTRARELLSNNLGLKLDDAICARWGNKVEIGFVMCRKVEG